MKSTGVVRSIDGLGRLVIPKELRRSMNINEGDPMEFYTEGDSIYIKKYSRGCIICGESRDTVTYKDKTLCRKCIDEIKKE